MTPKEKAQDIFSKMQMDFIYFASKEISKRNALIAVDEIIEFLLHCSKYLAFHKQVMYWQEVKQEIINL
jgi:hypothetical protein